MNRIKAVSRWIARGLMFARAGFVLYTLFALVFVEAGSQLALSLGVKHGFLGQFGESTPLPHPLPLAGRLILLGWVFIACGLYLRWLGHAIGLFKLYERGILFTVDNVRHFRGIGAIALLLALLRPACAMTINHWVLPSDVRVDPLEVIEIGYVLFAVVVLLIGWVMEEASKLREAEELVI